MITIFNQKELCVTFSGAKQAEIRKILNANQIHYKIRCISRRKSFIFTKKKIKDTNQHIDLMYQYVFYVKKSNYEVASGLIKR